MRIGFLGTGLIATYHSKSLRRSGADVERGPAFDPDAQRLSAFCSASGHSAARSEDEVLDGSDAVYVCTWTSEHERLAGAAAARGIAVFCEKPLAPDLAGAARLTAAVQRSGIVNQVGLVLRRSPAYLWARQLVADPAAGRVMAVVVRDDQFIPVQGHYGSTWRADRARAGRGTLLEHSIHDLDMLLHLTGESVVSVSAHEANFHGHDRIEDSVSVSLRLAGGGTATLCSVWHDNLARPSLRRVEVVCERRFVEIDGDDWFGPVRWTDADGSVGSLGGEALVAATHGLAPDHPNPDAAFVSCVAAARPAFPDLAVGLAAHELVDAVYRSAARGGAPARPCAAAERVVVREVATSETHDLRRRVLRSGTPSSDVTYPQDELPGTFHLGAFVDGALVGTSSWASEDWPGADGSPALRLRGMAVEQGLHGAGVGAELVAAGAERAGRSGIATIWATARDAVLGFYTRCGFEVVGDGFVDGPTALPHHEIVRRR